MSDIEIIKIEKHSLEVQHDGATSSMDLLQFCRNAETCPAVLFKQLCNQQRLFRTRISELENILAAKDDVKNESDSTMNEASEEENLSTALQIENITPIQSAETPDPPILTGHMALTFANWKFLMEKKLAADAGHFDTPGSISYLISRTSGEAQEQLLTRLRSKSLPPITNVKDALRYLTMLYDDPRPKVDHPVEFHSLRGEKSQFWNTFREFIWNVVKEEIPEANWGKKLFDYLEWTYDYEDKSLDFTCDLQGDPKKIAEQFYWYTVRERREGEDFDPV
ncbi:hypothetical protein P175DRAFT_0503272 [Aspergillus ochraceoroseus IBT 24754]|uniref:Uncharacterized protein n=1 Tax=Aspergillus ochraceoroseus IBT 24754 TaxID=1392256 RepID=A0A2T5LQB1_9EURO|nr:uncharacterized protein P175DRAFT_0503272 [Aspergillus ochraceoroseus IBT 24754]PTU18471.1 hypothetical protein P175DRAFT_0503272 [Aspergillus ochraceoroseus IBT 24754]